MNLDDLNYLGKKARRRFGARANEAVSTETSNTAKKMMEKMGWTEGQGLGKNSDGRSTHIATKKREDKKGLGHGKLEVSQGKTIDWSTEAKDGRTHELWWNDVYSKNSDKKKKKKKKKKSKKKRKRSDSDDSSDDDDLDAKLFKACGGTRLGMRARGEQDGKFKRTEEADSIFLAKYGGGDYADKKKKSSSSDKSPGVKDSPGREKKSKKEKKEKKEKKSKKEKKKKKE